VNGMSAELIRLLEFLLPGFIAAWVFYGLTSYPRSSQFERVIQALIYTLIIRALVGALQLVLGTDWTEDLQTATSVGVAVAFGVSISWLANTDGFHRLLRKAGITRETSYPSEWFGSFLNRVTFIVVQLKDGRRVYGWPREWPSHPKRGHFLLEVPSWLDGKNEIPIVGASAIMIDSEDVRWVEFIDTPRETRDGQESVKSSTPENYTSK